MLEQMIQRYKEVKSYFEEAGVYSISDYLLMEFDNLQKLASERGEMIEFESVNRPDIDYSHNAYINIGNMRLQSVIRYCKAEELDLIKKETAEAIAK